MKYSIKEIKDRLKADFSDSADLSVREFVLKSSRGVKAAVITMEGLCDK